MISVQLMWITFVGAVTRGWLQWLEPWLRWLEPLIEDRLTQLVFFAIPPLVFPIAVVVFLVRDPLPLGTALAVVAIEVVLFWLSFIALLPAVQ